jgi:osmotically-inducible protein OsmY
MNGGEKRALVVGLGIGAALMYLLDPDRGNRRRHLAVYQARKGLRRGGRELHDVAEDVKNHARGTVIEARNRMRDELVDDTVLVERVRAELGHRVEHARDIVVTAENGNVILTGTAPAAEIERAGEVACHVRGVQCVENQLSASAAT